MHGDHISNRWVQAHHNDARSIGNYFCNWNITGEMVQGKLPGLGCKKTRDWWGMRTPWRTCSLVTSIFVDGELMSVFKTKLNPSLSNSPDAPGVDHYSMRPVCILCLAHVWSSICWSKTIRNTVRHYVRNSNSSLVKVARCNDVLSGKWCILHYQGSCTMAPIYSGCLFIWACQS